MTNSISSRSGVFKHSLEEMADAFEQRPPLKKQRTVLHEIIRTIDANQELNGVVEDLRNRVVETMEPTILENDPVLLGVMQRFLAAYPQAAESIEINSDHQPQVQVHKILACSVSQIIKFICEDLKLDKLALEWDLAVLEQVKNFIQTGDTSGINLNNVFQVLFFSHQYHIPGLEKVCKQFFIHHREEIQIQTDFLTAWNAAKSHHWGFLQLICLEILGKLSPSDRITLLHDYSLSQGNRKELENLLAIYDRLMCSGSEISYEFLNDGSISLLLNISTLDGLRTYKELIKLISVDKVKVNFEHFKIVEILLALKDNNPQLELDITFQDFNPMQATTAIEALRLLNVPTQISINGNFIGIAALRYFTENLPENCHLIHLDLKKIDSKGDSFVNCIEIIKNYPKLKSLSIKNTELNTTNIIDLIEAVRNRKVQIFMKLGVHIENKTAVKVMHDLAESLNPEICLNLRPRDLTYYNFKVTSLQRVSDYLSNMDCIFLGPELT